MLWILIIKKKVYLEEHAHLSSPFMSYAKELCEPVFTYWLFMIILCKNHLLCRKSIEHESFIIICT